MVRVKCQPSLRKSKEGLMTKPRAEAEARHILREPRRDLDNGLTIADACRQHGVGAKTCYRWRERLEPETPGSARHVRRLGAEIGRLEPIAAALTLGKRMPRDAAKKKVVTAGPLRAGVGWLTG